MAMLCHAARALRSRCVAQPSCGPWRYAGGNARHLTTVETTDSGVAVLTLNNPDKLNAMTEELGESFLESLAAIKADESIRATVITGAGRAFSAGGDVNFLNDRTESSALDNTDVMLKFYSRFMALRTLPTPTIAAINGPAIGAGLCVACLCDMRVAATNAKMGWTFVGLGLHPGMGATHFTSLLVGQQQAYYRLLSGKVFDGAEAERIGLVLEAVEADQVLPTAIKIASEIASQSPVAVKSLVRALRAKQNIGLEASLLSEADSQAHSYAAADIKEGIGAIVERRRPVF